MWRLARKEREGTLFLFSILVEYLDIWIFAVFII